MEVETCGCCSLKTGTIIIGASDIVVSVIFLILIFTTDLHQRKIRTVHLDVKTVKTICTVSLCVAIGISTLLIIGALKKNTCLMRPWLILRNIGIIGFCVIILTAWIVPCTIGIQAVRMCSFFEGVLWFIFGLIAVAINMYLRLVVYNYRKELLIEKINMGTGPYGSPYNYQQN